MASFTSKTASSKASTKDASKTASSVTASANNAENIARWGLNLESTEDMDDWSSEWQEVLDGKCIWGGRTKGGRGVQRIKGYTKDISVEGITLAFCGKELLQRTTLKLVHEHRYGLIGDNGVGKSTLLRRIAKQSLPGIPLHFRYGYVQQEILLADKDKNKTVLEFILGSREETMESLQEGLEVLRLDEKEIEDMMDSTTDNDKLGELAEKLCSITEEIDRIEAKLAAPPSEKKKSDATETLTRAGVEVLGPEIVNVLDGLGLSKPLKRLSMKISELSGGWRMRASLAQCLCAIDKIDVLLLDEPTNHLDLPTIAWLQEYLVSSKVIVLFVSHDRSFLATVATDIIEMHSLQLVYFNGNYEDYLRNLEEMGARRAHLADARIRKEAQLQRAMDLAHARGDDRAAKTKQKKLERASMTRGIDGHRFKNFSIAKMDEKYLHLAETIDISEGAIPSKTETTEEQDYRFSKFKFPTITDSIASLRLPSPDTSPLLSLEQVTLSYLGRDKPLLEKVTLSIGLKSRVGIIGRNGQGKTTLLHALAYAASHTSQLGLEVPSHGAGRGKGRSTQSTTPATKRAISTTTEEVVEVGGGLVVLGGHIWRHHNLKIGVVSQHQIDLLSNHLSESPLSYCQKILSGIIIHNTHFAPSGHEGSGATEVASTSVSATSASVASEGGNNDVKRESELRALLGGFGLSGRLALQPIGSLSGGQKARLSFAAVCLQRPHLLFLDEPSNHLSMEAIEGLIGACREFAGGIVLISHNRYLLSQICHELYVVSKGVLTVKKTVADGENKAELRSEFESILDKAIEEQIFAT